MSDLVGDAEDRFSRVTAHLLCTILFNLFTLLQKLSKDVSNVSMAARGLGFGFEHMMGAKLFP